MVFYAIGSCWCSRSTVAIHQTIFHIQSTLWKENDFSSEMTLCIIHHSGADAHPWKWRKTRKFYTILVLTQFNTKMTSSSNCWFRELQVHRLGSVTVRKCYYPAGRYSQSFPSAGEKELSRENWASVHSLKTVPYSNRAQSWQGFTVSQCVTQYFKPAKELLSAI